MLKKYVCVVIIVMTFTQCSKHELESEENPVDFSTLEESYDIQINYKYSKSFFPGTWLQPPVSGYGIQIEYSEAERMVQIIDDCLIQYSKTLINSNLTDIYLLKRMYFYNRGYGGTYSQSSLYITNDGYNYEDLIDLLHAEFSSILFSNYSSSFPIKEWSAINDSEFEYSGTGLEVLVQSDLFGQTEELLMNGFLAKYSTSSLENDFNRFVAWKFTKPNELLELCKKYDKIREKYNLVEEFYNQIDSGVKF